MSLQRCDYSFFPTKEKGLWLGKRVQAGSSQEGWKWKTTLPPLRLESGDSGSGGSSGVLKDLLIHVFNKYLLSTYHVPGTIPVWDGTVNKSLSSWTLHPTRGKE